MESKIKIIAIFIIVGIGSLGIFLPILMNQDESESSDDTPTSNTRNKAPIINDYGPDANPVVDEGESLVFSVSAIDPDGDSLSYYWKINETSIGSNYHSYTYNPDYNAAGFHELVIYISDGKDTVNQSWLVYVNDVNRAPIITNPFPNSDPTINEGESQEFNISASDPDGDIISYHWTVDGNSVGDNSNTYTMLTDFDDEGTYVVMINVSDGSLLYSTSQWTLYVGGVNHPPNINNYEPSEKIEIFAGESQEFNVSATDIDGNPLTFQWFLNETLVGTNSSKYIYNTTHEDEGHYNISLQVTDGEAIAMRSWTLTVKGLVNLVSDIREGTLDGFDGGKLVMGGYFYFRAMYPDMGRELWRSDGTESGTSLVKDIWPGISSSIPMYFVLNESGDVFYFTANNGTHGTELWRSDGTEAGTYCVKDIAPGAAGSNIFGLTLLNGILYFRASDGLHGSELWRSDGTESGTYMVKDIHPSDSSSPIYITAMGDKIYFSADNGVCGIELWESNGTDIGTKLLIDINPGSVSSNPSDLFSNGTLLYFAAENGSKGIEPWRSDGTSEGTFRLADLYPGGMDSEPDDFTRVGNLVYFVAHGESTIGKELFVSDGTVAGTHLVKDIRINGDGFPYSNNDLIAFGDILIFSVYNESSNEEIWRTNGTEEGTWMVGDFNPTGSFSPNRYINVGDRLIFMGNNGTIGHELWSTDGTAEGTYLIKDINPGPNHGSPLGFAILGDLLLFQADHIDYGVELWSYKFR